MLLSSKAQASLFTTDDKAFQQWLAGAGTSLVHRTRFAYRSKYTTLIFEVPLQQNHQCMIHTFR